MSSSIRSMKRGVSWGSLSVVATTLVQVLLMAVMARLLNPRDFGLMAVALVGVRFLSYFAQIGTTPALVQKSELTRGDIAAALVVSLSVSLILCGVLYVSAPAFAAFFGMRDLTSIFRVLAPIFVANAFTSISLGLLKRNKQFKQVAIVEILSYLVGYAAVGLFFAVEGYGVWALVAANLGQAVSAFVIGYYFARFKISFRHSLHERQYFLAFGGKYSIVGFLEFINSNLDSIVIGKFVGASAAGLYSRAFLLANLPVQKPVNVLTAALFPTLCSLTGRREEQYVGFMLSSLFAGLFAFSISMGVSVAAEPIVKVMLGTKWSEVAPILKLLALSVGPVFMTHVASVTLDALGELNTKLIIQGCCLALLIFLFYILHSYGTIGLATSVVIVEWVKMAVFLVVMKHKLSGQMGDFIKLIAMLLIASLSGVVAIWTSLRAALFWELSATPVLGISIVSGALGLLIGAVAIKPILESFGPFKWFLLTKPSQSLFRI